MNHSKSSPFTKPVGLIGLGLMGQGIASCLLSRGFHVVAYNRTASRAQASLKHIAPALSELARRKVVPKAAVTGWRERYRLTDTIEELGACFFVVETVKEDFALKCEIYDQLESAVKPSTVIASNTSSIPITLLQKGRRHPERFIGMHWGEPAEIMQYLEIIPGKQTSPRTINLTRRIAAACGKMPTVLKFDIRGFISNRLMYAMLREAFHLVETGVADIETIDRSYRNDMGWWSTIAGPFRWMDLTGIPAYMTVMKDLLPELDRSTTVPKLMRQVVKSGALGIANRKGFYKYTRAEAAKWEKIWVDFTYDIRALAEKYQKRAKS